MCVCIYVYDLSLNLSLSPFLQDAFSLLAYSDPWNSPVGYQLDSIQREPVCSTLNSAILGRYSISFHILEHLFSNFSGQVPPLIKSEQLSHHSDPFVAFRIKKISLSSNFSK